MTNKKTTTEHKSFWESFITSNKEEAWRDLNAQVDSKIEKGGFLESDKMHLYVGNWTITLDEFAVRTNKSSTTYTRMRAPFKANSDFRFCITPHNLFRNIAIKLFGAQDIQINDSAFDNRFVIEGNNEWKVRQLLSSESLRHLLLSQGDRIQFSLKDDEGWFGTSFPKGVDELYFCTVGTVRDADVLRSMYELFTETLLQLKQMDVASTENPGVKLQ